MPEGMRAWLVLDQNEEKATLFNPATLEVGLVPTPALTKGQPISLKPLRVRQTIIDRVATHRRYGFRVPTQAEQVLRDLGAGERTINGAMGADMLPEVAAAKVAAKVRAAKAAEIVKHRQEETVARIACRRIEQDAAAEDVAARLFAGVDRAEIVKMFKLNTGAAVWDWLAKNIAPKHGAVVLRDRTIKGKTTFRFRKAEGNEPVGGQYEVKA